MLQIGDKAPDFTLLSDERQEVTLSGLRGQRVVLFFYPSSGSASCTKQACGFADNFPMIEAAGATVLGISPDDVRALEKWRAKMGFPYNLLADPTHEVALAYGVWGPKKLFGREYEGIIRSHFVIDPSGRIEDRQIKVFAQDSVQRALSYLQNSSEENT